MQYSILINTCDKFEDCWNPFFKLFKLYWPDCRGIVYLNTEYKDYSYPGLSVVPVKGCVGKSFKGKFATWSSCLKWALDKMDSDIVLYMQEDYFLKAPVKNDLVEKYVKLMYEHPDIKCIHLTDQAVRTCGKSEYENLDIVEFNQRYRVSCQAALWRRDELYALIRDYEDAWQFEEFGSQRSAVMKSKYLCVSRDFVKLNQFEIIPYIFTGIVQGRWYEETVPLFEKHGIEMDFSKRGMLKDAPKKSFFKRVKYRVNKIKAFWIQKKELKKLKKKYVNL
jgi:hypothetical protein